MQTARLGPALARLRGTVEIPLFVFGLTMVALWLVAAERGHAFLDDVTWIHWDAGHYLKIAVDGYELDTCPPEDPKPGLCGNTAWFPLYPWLVGALYHLGLPLGSTAIVISNLFVVGELILVWLLFDRRATPAAISALVFVAFIPGAIYHHAPFPMSVLGFFILLCLYLCKRERLAWAGVAGAAAAASYPIGTLVVPALAVWVWLVYRALSVREKLRRTFQTAGLAALGPVCVVVAQWAQTGYLDGFWIVQERYDSSIASPFTKYWNNLESLFHHPRQMGAVIAVQTVFVGLVVVACVVAFVLRRGWLSPVDTLAVLIVLPMWIVPLTQRNQSIWRAEAALVALALLLRYLPIRLQVALVSVAVTLGLLLPAYFFSNLLV